MRHWNLALFFNLSNEIEKDIRRKSRKRCCFFATNKALLVLIVFDKIGQFLGSYIGKKI